MKSQDYAGIIEAHLERLLGADGAAPELDEAMRYAVLGGGKRLRPSLLLMTADALTLPPSREDAALDLAAAIELIHSYSLVHDDLPCMDDDTMRRGKPTVHVRYGYAEAVLAGDALLNLAYELILGAVESAAAADRLAVAGAGRIIARLAGRNGMVAGQLFDIKGTGSVQASAVDGRTTGDRRSQLISLQRLKTGGLLTAPVLAAARLCDASDEVTALLGDYAAAIGLAFQIQDDILDVKADPDALGKSTGKDARDNKLTFVTALGMEEAEAEAARQTQAALDACEGLLASGCDSRGLAELAGALQDRQA